jgi:glycosyltransferase involved in cell wall biosynthesis
MVRQYRWAKRQQALFGSYSAIVVASDYMRDEYIRNGAPAEKVYPLPLFAPAAETSTPRDGDRKADRVLFFGRMTPLKGGDLLVKAVAYAAEKLGRPVPLTMAGDGPARPGWEALARELRVPAEFPGWIDPATRPSHLRRSIVLAMPSVWPEPFGLVGLEAAAEGVPTIAFDTGGVRAWLQDGISGVIAGPHPDAKALGRALVSVCSDENRRLQLAAGALATARAMTIDRHVERLVDQVLEPACASRLAL